MFRTFFVGERITQADLTLFSALKLLFDNLLDEAGRKPYPHVLRWYTTVANQPEVKKIVGEVKLCETPLVPDLKNAPKREKQKGGDKKQEKQQPNKQEHKEEKPGAAEGDTDAKPAKQPKNPIALLPEGTFIYDEFKRVFSNEDTEKVAIPFFWDKFDSTTDSIWECEYKYPEELKLTFMSTNLLRGMFQRLDK